MTVQTHTVSTDALATLGTIIDDTAGRDAIHLAVEPVMAVEKLYPGQHVGFVEGGVGTSKSPVGIVDPFLVGFVAPGQRFWLVVYPRTITSLRHVWEHPAFSAFEEPSFEAKTMSPKDTSVAWMTAWAEKHMGYDYYGEDDRRSTEAAFASAIDAGRNQHIGPYESARDYIDNVWWDHWETITGERGSRGDYFSCSC